MAYPDERIRILPHPTPRVSRSKTARKTRQRWPNSDCRPITFFIRHSLNHKNHQYGILRILHLKEKDNLRHLLSSTGSNQGNEEVTIRQLVTADTAAGRSVQPLECHVSRPALRALYQNAFVLVIRVFWAHAITPPLEAFALGCPVIAADIPGTKRTVR